MSVRIDLHTHSSESDGTDTPSELVATAIAAGLDVIALTDHDTTAGWAEADHAIRREAGAGGFRVVPGAELSCQCSDGAGRTVTVHLLAYLFDPLSPVLVEEQRRLRAQRRARLRTMAFRMAEDGFAIDPDELMASMPVDFPGGRPHLARALVRAGIVASVDEAFARYLGAGGAYYLPRTDTPVRTAVNMIEEAGGVTVLAHPFAARGPAVTAEVIAELAGHGLTGLEVDHPDHDEAARVELRGIASELDLVVTGSSDYHGTNKTIRIGQELTAPESLEALIARSHGSRVLDGSIPD